MEAGMGSSRGRMFAAVAAAALVVTACGGTGDADPGTDDAAAPVDGEGRSLVVSNWNDYGTDISWAVEAYEEQTGAQLVHQYFNSPEELLTTLRSGGVGEIGVAMINVAFMAEAVEEGLVVPIDLSRLQNADELSDDLLAEPDLTHDGELYGVPWVWGSTSLAYNEEAFPDGIDSWEALWDPANAGDVGFFDDAATAVMTAALYLGEDPYDPDLDAVREALLDLKGNTQLFWSSADDWLRAFQSGSVTLGNLWSGLAGTQLGAGDPIVYVVPQEGAVGWLDTLAIVADAPDEDLAYAFIDWMISAEFQTGWAEDEERSSPAPANATVHPNLDAEVADRIQSDPAALDTLTVQRGIPQDVLQQWTELWQEVKAG
jgi:spermidine/putrescine transport system substrate-binding protein